MSSPPPRDAATIVLLRQGPGPEIYLLRRHGKSRFMGGVFVFPGGKVDEADCDPALTDRLAGPDGTAWARIMGDDLPPDRARGHAVAALRETFEESGVLLTTNGAIANDDVRKRLHAGALDFRGVLEALDVTLDLGALRYLDHWITPPIEPRRFSARFFAAVVPSDQEATPDDAETTEGAWLGPQAAVSRYFDPDDHLQLAPPTLRLLQRFGRHDTVEAALSEAPHAPVRPRAPRLVQTDAGPSLVLPGDPLHPTQAGDARARFVLRDGRWHPDFA